MTEHRAVVNTAGTHGLFTRGHERRLLYGGEYAKIVYPYTVIMPLHDYPGFDEPTAGFNSRPLC